MDSEIIPFSDISVQVKQMEASLMQAIGEVVNSSKFISGRRLNSLKSRLQSFAPVDLQSGSEAVLMLCGLH